MSIRTLIDGGLQYLTKRRTDNITKKQGKGPAGERCRSCGSAVIEVNVNSHRRACVKCGKEVI